VPLEWKILSRREVKTIDRTQLTVLDWCHEFSNHDRRQHRREGESDPPQEHRGCQEAA